MNGGKDFSAWSKKDDLLYQTLRIPVEAVLGKDGFCLADTAIAESKFEKGEDISARMLSMMGRIHEIQQNGTPDIEFAAVGLLSRSQFASGRADDARHTLELLRTRFEKQGEEAFPPQHRRDALPSCLADRRSGHSGELVPGKGTKRPQRLNVMKRYQYLTQAMAELTNGRPDAALLTLAPLRTYCQVCRRHIDGIHLICYMPSPCTGRMTRCGRSICWRRWTQQRSFPSSEPSACTANAALPLLETLSWDKDSKWGSRLMGAVRMQASCYPAFFAAAFTPWRGTDGSGNAGSAPDLR